MAARPSAPRQIIAIGGGGFSAEPYDPSLDLYILGRANAARPKVCFVPKAAGNSERGIGQPSAAYGSGIMDVEMVPNGTTPWS